MRISNDYKENDKIISDCINGLIPLDKAAEKLKSSRRNTSIKKIGLYFWGIPNNGNGTVQVIKELAGIFNSLGFIVYIITEELPSENDMIIDNTIRLTITRARDWHSIECREKRIEELSELVINNQIDLVIDNFFYSSMLPWNILAALRGGNTKYVVYDHGYIASWMNLIEDVYADRFEWYKMADAVISLSKVHKHLFDCMEIPSKIFSNPSSVSGYTVSECRNYNRVIWVGRLEFEKKPIDALRVFKIVNDYSQDIELYVYGQGSLEDQMREFLIHERLNNVHLMGFCEQIHDEYAKADLLLLTSERESWSLVIHEALALGIPVVAYDIPNLDVLSIENGVLCVKQDDISDLARTIIKVLHDKELYNSLSKAAQTWFETRKQYDISSEWKEFIEVLSNNKSHLLLSKVENNQKKLVQQLIRYHSNGMKAAVKQINELIPDASKGRSRTYRVGEMLMRIPNRFLRLVGKKS